MFLLRLSFSIPQELNIFSWAILKLLSLSLVATASTIILGLDWHPPIYADQN